MSPRSFCVDSTCFGAAELERLVQGLTQGLTQATLTQGLTQATLTGLL